MLTKNIFQEIAKVWLSQEKGRNKSQLANVLGVSKQYISRAFSSKSDDGISSKYIDHLMLMTDCAIIIYPKGYFKIISLKSEQKVEENKND